MTKKNLVIALTNLTEKQVNGVKLNRKDRRAKIKISRQLGDVAQTVIDSVKPTPNRM